MDTRECSDPPFLSLGASVPEPALQAQLHPPPPLACPQAQVHTCLGSGPSPRGGPIPVSVGSLASSCFLRGDPGCRGRGVETELRACCLDSTVSRTPTCPRL